MRNDTFKIDLVRKVCAQVKKFIVSTRNFPRTLIVDLLKDNPRVESGLVPEWIIGEDGIKIEQLVLVSLKRVSAGCWIPCLRLISERFGPSHELSLAWVVRQLMVS